MSDRGLHIRPYTASDWSRLCEVHDAARRNELARAALTEAFLPLEQAAAAEGLFDYTILVAEIDGAVEGFVAFSDAELGWLYVHPNACRRGVGTSLVRAALAATGQAMTVEVLDGNAPALRLYANAGFAVVGRSSGRMPGNERFAVAVVELRFAGVA